jgi:uncharacterized membrane protein YtjA (UPF0391 family)
MSPVPGWTRRARRGTELAVATAGRSGRRVISPVRHKEINMLQLAAVFFVIALIAAIFGFGGIAAGAVEIGKILFFIFLVIFIVTFVLGIMRS